MMLTHERDVPSELIDKIASHFCIPFCLHNLGGTWEGVMIRIIFHSATSKATSTVLLHLKDILK